jgi:hypothetical protein
MYGNDGSISQLDALFSAVEDIKMIFIKCTIV